MYKTIIKEIEIVMDYIDEQERKGWKGTLEDISKKYKHILSLLEWYNFSFNGLRYEDIADSVKGNDMEFGAITCNLKVIKSQLEEYESDENETISEPCFNKIKTKIIEQIRSAKLCIWVAVAWFTDQEIYNELIEANNRGLNVQIITLKESNKYNMFINSVIEPLYFPDYNKNDDNLHHKFCIFDFRIVITGSYNFTNQATKNFENVLIIKNLELAEKYALEFVKLKSEIIKNKKQL